MVFFRIIFAIIEFDGVDREVPRFPGIIVYGQLWNVFEPSVFSRLVVIPTVDSEDMEFGAGI